MKSSRARYEWQRVRRLTRCRSLVARLRWTGRSSRALALMFVLSSVAVVNAQVQGEWSWPSDRVETLTPVSGRWFRIELNSDGGGRAVAPGRVIYRDRSDVTVRPAVGMGPRTVPQAIPRVVVQHPNEIVSVYRGAELRLLPGPRPGFRVDEGSSAALEFTMIDGLPLTAVQPRALLPERPGLPESGMPVLGFFQDGELVLSRNLEPGPYELTVPAQWLEPVALPRTITILRDGLLVADLSLVDPEYVSGRLDVSGNLVLHRGELDPGPGMFDIEVRRYDGNLEQRTIRFRIPEPAPALDTR